MKRSHLVIIVFVLLVLPGCSSTNGTQSFVVEGESWKGELLIHDTEPVLYGSGELVHTTFEYMGEGDEIHSIKIHYRSGGNPYEYSISHPIETLPENKLVKDEYEISFKAVLNALEFIPFLIEWSEDGNEKEEELLFQSE